jgi:uncharacterized protein
MTTLSQADSPTQMRLVRKTIVKQAKTSIIQAILSAILRLSMMPRLIADENVGKLGRWLRLLGFDTILFSGEDRELIRQALAENRIILTRDTHIALIRPVVGGFLKFVTLVTDRPEEQICRVMRELGLKDLIRPLTRCLECNTLLADITREEVQDRVPSYVYQTQTQFVACPGCRRIYWRGTHWQAMQKRLAGLISC